MTLFACQPRQPQLAHRDPAERWRNVLATRFGDLDAIREHLSVPLGLEAALISLAVVVSRPTRFGNPYPVIDGDRAQAVARYRQWLGDGHGPGRDDLESLRGKDLCCWCPLDQPCHADVLLELANAPTSDEETQP